MRGHATAEEQARVRELESRLDPKTSPLSSLLELALLYRCPCHEEDRSIRLLEGILDRDGDFSAARIWLGYLHLHYSLDPASIKKARQLLESVPDGDRIHRAASLQLLAAVGEDLNDLSTSEIIRLLEASVELAPHWVNNRDLLAAYLARTGDTAAAEAQLRAALDNVIAADPAWSPAEREFEISITGRTADRVAERLTSHLTQLEV